MSFSAAKAGAQNARQPANNSLASNGNVKAIARRISVAHRARKWRQVMYNRETEIREAIVAGERALQSLKEAKSSLGSARNWGLFDLFGGRTISELMKHVKIGDAKSS